MSVDDGCYSVIIIITSGFQSGRAACVGSNRFDEPTPVKPTPRFNIRGHVTGPRQLSLLSPVPRLVRSSKSFRGDLTREVESYSPSADSSFRRTTPYRSLQCYGLYSKIVFKILQKKSYRNLFGLFLFLVYCVYVF